MSYFFASLPSELQTRVLQTIINTGASSLPPFLQAFPELSTLVLLISDHFSITDHLADISGCRVVDIDDHDVISHIGATKPITVLSFMKCDEEAAFGRLTRSPDCLYGRYMDSKSAVFVQLSGKALFGHDFIKSLVREKGCSPDRQLVIRHHRHREKSSHVEMVGGATSRPGKSVISSPLPECLKMWNYRPEDPEVPWGVGLPYQKSVHLLRWSKITDISIHCMWRTFGEVKMPHLERIRISAPLASKCFDEQRLFGTGSSCDFCWYGMEYAYRVKEVYYEFSASRTPVICSGLWTCSKISQADQFSFINMDWSESDPTLSSSLCEHAQEYGCDYVRWSQSSDQEPLTFLKIFNTATFIGIPDLIIILSTLTKTKRLIWKRLMPVNPHETAETHYIIRCPSLETLDITTLLRSHDETDPMPQIDAPHLRKIDLCAVHGSNMAWNLQFHFTQETLASVQEVSMTTRLLDDSQSIPLRLEDLVPLTSSLEFLFVVGYNPLFVMPMDDDLGAVFSKLATLYFDMGYFPLETFPGQPRPLVSVLLERDIFPVLQHLKLDLSSRKRSPLLHDGVCNVRIQVSWSCQLLTVLEPLAANRFFVVKEDEARCRGKNITNKSFYPAVGKLAFWSVDL